MEGTDLTDKNFGAYRNWDSPFAGVNVVVGFLMCLQSSVSPFMVLGFSPGGIRRGLYAAEGLTMSLDEPASLFRYSGHGFEFDRLFIRGFQFRLQKIR